MGAIKSLLECPDFTVELLLWASKCALESGNNALLSSILNQILEAAKINPRNVEQVDLLTLIRSVFKVNDISVASGSQIIQHSSLIRLTTMGMDSAKIDQLSPAGTRLCRRPG